MTVPKLTSDNFEGVDLAFQGAARMKIFLSGILLDYLLLPNDAGKYDSVYSSRKEELNSFVIFVGQSYKADSEILWTLLVQHVGTSGPVSNIIAKH